MFQHTVYMQRFDVYNFIVLVIGFTLTIMVRALVCAKSLFSIKRFIKDNIYRIAIGLMCLCFIEIVILIEGIDKFAQAFNLLGISINKVSNFILGVGLGILTTKTFEVRTNGGT